MDKIKAQFVTSLRRDQITDTGLYPNEDIEDVSREEHMERMGYELELSYFQLNH
jgi:hypothetical protein